MIIRRYLLSFLFSFNGMMYELMLSQNLSAALGGTLLRYFITVGLFTLCLGFSALLFDYLPEKIKTSSNLRRLNVFFLVGLIFLPLYFYCLDYFLKIDLYSYSFFQYAYHLPLVAIAIVTGFEIPFLFHGQTDELKSKILAFDYGGMFFACLAFPLFLIENFGLFGTFALALVLQFVILWQIRRLL